MIKVRLETSSGELVAIKDMMPFKVLPEMVMWGSRFFMLDTGKSLRALTTAEEDFVAVYREGFCYALVDYAEAIHESNNRPQ